MSPGRGLPLFVILILDVPHRQVVLTIPKTLRIFFKYRRRLLGELSRAAVKALTLCFEVLTGGPLVPGIIVAVNRPARPVRRIFIRCQSFLTPLEGRTILVDEARMGFQADDGRAPMSGRKRNFFLSFRFMRRFLSYRPGTLLNGKGRSSMKATWSSAIPKSRGSKGKSYPMPRSCPSRRRARRNNI